jgi:hypothetical protein
LFELRDRRYYAGVWYVRWAEHDAEDWQAMLYREQEDPQHHWRLELLFRRKVAKHEYRSPEGEPLTQLERSHHYLLPDLTPFMAAALLDALANLVIRKTNAKFQACLRVDGEVTRFQKLLEEGSAPWFLGQAPEPEAPPSLVDVHGPEDVGNLPMPAFMAEFEEREWN